MTRDQQKCIIDFIVRATEPGQPEPDVEADSIIRALFVRNPDAAYRLTMLAMAQDMELKARALNGCPAQVQANYAGGWLAGVLRRIRKSKRHPQSLNPDHSVAK